MIIRTDPARFLGLTVAGNADRKGEKFLRMLHDAAEQNGADVSADDAQPQDDDNDGLGSFFAETKPHGTVGFGRSNPPIHDEIPIGVIPPHPIMLGDEPPIVLEPPEMPPVALLAQGAEHRTIRRPGTGETPPTIPPIPSVDLNEPLEISMPASQHEPLTAHVNPDGTITISHEPVGVSMPAPQLPPLTAHVNPDGSTTVSHEPVAETMPAPEAPPVTVTPGPNGTFRISHLIRPLPPGKHFDSAKAARNYLIEQGATLVQNHPRLLGQDVFLLHGRYYIIQAVGDVPGGIVPLPSQYVIYQIPAPPTTRRR